MANYAIPLLIYFPNGEHFGIRFDRRHTIQQIRKWLRERRGESPFFILVSADQAIPKPFTTVESLPYETPGVRTVHVVRSRPIVAAVVTGEPTAGFIFAQVQIPYMLCIGGPTARTQRGQDLDCCVQAITSNGDAIALLTTEGKVLRLKNAMSKRPCLSYVRCRRQVLHIQKTRSAFAAILDDRTVETWGDGMRGGCCHTVQHLLHGVIAIQANNSAFAALRDDGTVVTWGLEECGGDSTDVQDLLHDIVAIQSTDFAFAAITENGTVICWGRADSGGDASNVASRLQDVIAIQSTGYAFAALRATGEVVTWGLPQSGGDCTHVQPWLRNIVAIQSSTTTFAALSATGQVVSWSYEDFAYPVYEIATFTSPARALQANNVSIVAILEDGHVATLRIWSHSIKVRIQQREALHDIVSVAATCEAFAALRSDGVVVAFGNRDCGGDCSHIEDELHDIVELHASARAFAAIRRDGLILTWGDPPFGGDIGCHSRFFQAVNE